MYNIQPITLGRLAIMPGHKEVVVQTPTERHSLTCRDAEDVKVCTRWLREYVETHEVACEATAIKAMLARCNESVEC